jgi:quinoprotein glucose dehydrogenase
MRLVTRFDVDVDDDRIAAWARDTNRSVETRVESLKLFVKRQSVPAGGVLDAFLASDDPILRATAREQLAQIDPGAALASIRDAFDEERTTVREIQAGLDVLSAMKSKAAQQLIADSLNWFINPSKSDQVAARHAGSVELDVLTAAEKHNEGEIADLLDQYDRRIQAASDHDPLAPFRAALRGGDAQRGERVFRVHRYAQCMRCHKTAGEGGDAGPDLSQVALRADREHLLESIVAPDARIAKGFGTMTLLTNDGRVITGVVQEEADEQVTLKTADDGIVTVPRSEIDEQVAARSPMPGYHSLPKQELRDLVEYLSTQK